MRERGRDNGRKPFFKNIMRTCFTNSCLSASPGLQLILIGLSLSVLLATSVAPVACSTSCQISVAQPYSRFDQGQPPSRGTVSSLCPRLPGYHAQTCGNSTTQSVPSGSRIHQTEVCSVTVRHSASQHHLFFQTEVSQSCELKQNSLDALPLK